MIWVINWTWLLQLVRLLACLRKRWQTRDKYKRMNDELKPSFNSDYFFVLLKIHNIYFMRWQRKFKMLEISDKTILLKLLSSSSSGLDYIHSGSHVTPILTNCQKPRLLTIELAAKCTPTTARINHSMMPNIHQESYLRLAPWSPRTSDKA